MISQYSKPKDIDREFWDDYPKAIYWLKKHTSSHNVLMKMYDAWWDIYQLKDEYRHSEPVFYISPTTGNRWITWLTSMRDKEGEIHTYCRAAIYHLTAAFMTIMIPVTTVDENEKGERKNEKQGVNVYTSHMFQRFADPDRLGVDMSDRLNVIRNFTEFVATGWSDTRPPREGEKHTQIMLRTPASWIRGHTLDIGKRHVTIYRTFWTDRSMSYNQLKDVRSFKKFADAKYNNK